MNLENSPKAIRGNFVDFVNVVQSHEEIEGNVRHIQDGLLLIKNGKIEWFGPWEDGRYLVPEGVTVNDYSGKFIVPGFIDGHIHYPQTEMIGAYGEQLLEWLNNYTFPTERRYGDKDYAKDKANFFVKQLLRNGTTTALTFCSVHPESVDALFETAEQINMRIIAGKVMMDRNAPDYLLDTAQSSYDESKALIGRWHEKGRSLYAITPRFAPTSTPEQLDAAGALMKEHPTAYMQTHLSENKNEIAWVKSLFPESSSYLDVYHRRGLTGKRSVFAHCIHLEDEEWDCMRETNSVIAFCPTSNFYLGSGLFDWRRSEKNQVRITTSTDVGAGTSFSLIQTLNEAYKVLQMQGQKMSAFESLYSATLGSAAALSLEDKIGNFTVGKEADFVVLNPTATPLQQLRYDNSKSLQDKLFVLFTLGDDRNVYRTYVDGRVAYERT